MLLFDITNWNAGDVPPMNVLAFLEAFNVTFRYVVPAFSITNAPLMFVVLNPVHPVCVIVVVPFIHIVQLLNPPLVFTDPAPKSTELMSNLNVVTAPTFTDVVPVAFDVTCPVIP